MNILDMLSKELAHLDLTLEEKARYLYIRCCELFTYDPRYRFCDSIPNGDKLKQEILHKKIDLENVTDNWIVCTSHINEVYIKLLKILLHIEAVPIISGKDCIHVWAKFKIEEKTMKADSALKLCSDLTRVKMRLETQEYHTVPYKENYLQKLKKMDQKIGYIKEHYQNYYLEQLSQNLKKETQNFNSEERILYKWNIAIQKLKDFSNTIYPLNQQICMNYLIIHLFTPEEQMKIKTTELFQITTDGNWCFANIYSLALSNCTKFYIQPRFQNQFNFYEIDEDTKKHYLSKMRVA